MMAYGRQGFNTSEAAKTDARESLLSNDQLEIAIVRKDNNYGWLFPLSYAKHIVESNKLILVETTTI